MYITEEQKELVRQYIDENLKGGLNCSETVFNALTRAGLTGLPEKVTALATGLNGGVACTGQTCGALAGAVMAVGSVYGRKETVNENLKMLKTFAKKQKVKTAEEDYRYYTMRRYNNLVADFKKELGTVQCQEIINRNGGYWQVKRKEDCVRCIKKGAELAIKYIEMESEESNKLPFSTNIFNWK